MIYISLFFICRSKCPITSTFTLCYKKLDGVSAFVSNGVFLKIDKRTCTMQESTFITYIIKFISIHMYCDEKNLHWQSTDLLTRQKYGFSDLPLTTFQMIRVLQFPNTILMQYCAYILPVKF